MNGDSFCAASPGSPWVPVVPMPPTVSQQGSSPPPWTFSRGDGRSSSPSFVPQQQQEQQLQQYHQQQYQQQQQQQQQQQPVEIPVVGANTPRSGPWLYDAASAAADAMPIVGATPATSAAASGRLITTLPTTMPGGGDGGGGPVTSIAWGAGEGGDGTRASSSSPTTASSGLGKQNDAAIGLQPHPVQQQQQQQQQPHHLPQNQPQQPQQQQLEQQQPHIHQWWFGGPGLSAAPVPSTNGSTATLTSLPFPNEQHQHQHRLFQPHPPPPSSSQQQQQQRLASPTGSAPHVGPNGTVHGGGGLAHCYDFAFSSSSQPQHAAVSGAAEVASAGGVGGGVVVGVGNTAASVTPPGTASCSSFSSSSSSSSAATPPPPSATVSAAAAFGVNGAGLTAVGFAPTPQIEAFSSSGGGGGFPAIPNAAALNSGCAGSGGGGGGFTLGSGGVGFGNMNGIGNGTANGNGIGNGIGNGDGHGSVGGSGDKLMGPFSIVQHQQQHQHLQPYQQQHQQQQPAPVFTTPPHAPLAPSGVPNGVGEGGGGAGVGDKMVTSPVPDKVVVTGVGPFPVQSFLKLNPMYPGLKPLLESPPLFLVENFLSPPECDALMVLADKYMIVSPVVGAGAGEISASRTSSSCFLAREDVPTVCSKVMALTGKPFEHLELPQVGRYYTSQKYANHWDAFDLDTEDGRRFAQNGGQRVCTVLVYLNDVASGGCTGFPRLGMRVQPRKGMAVVFFPATLDGTLDPMLLHAAEPAVDTKWVSQIWVRQGVYHGTPTARIPRI